MLVTVGVSETVLRRLIKICTIIVKRVSGKIVVGHIGHDRKQSCLKTGGCDRKQSCLKTGSLS